MFLVACTAPTTGPEPDDAVSTDEAADTEVVPDPVEGSLDERLRTLVTRAGAGPMPALPPADPALEAVGRELWFEPLLAPVQAAPDNLSCANCHATLAHKGSTAPVGWYPGIGFPPRAGPNLSDIGRIPGLPVFADGRSSVDRIAGAGTDDPLVAAIVAALQSPDHAAAFSSSETEAAESAARRIRTSRQWRRFLTAAAPDRPVDTWTPLTLAEAMATFVRGYFATGRTAWDDWLAGDTEAMSNSAKRGAVDFFQVGCASCHTGAAFTDGQTHVAAGPILAIPGYPTDLGLAVHTGAEADRHHFRTPMLRNVGLTPPYFHNGAFRTLAEAIRHHWDPDASLATFDTAKLVPVNTTIGGVRAGWEKLQLAPNHPALAAEALARVPWRPPEGEALTEARLRDLVAFLESLNDREWLERSTRVYVPVSQRP